MKNFLGILSVLLIVTGCASAPRATYNNEAIPGKTYTLHSTGAPISATALFYAIVPVKDIQDNAMSMEYLPLNENLVFANTEIEGLYTRISVTNPTKAVYAIKYNLAVTYADGRIEGKFVEIGRSALEQRTFTLKIPVPAKMMKASLFVYMENDKGRELLRIGDFKYAVNFPHVSR